MRLLFSHPFSVMDTSFYFGGEGVSLSLNSLLSSGRLWPLLQINPYDFTERGFFLPAGMYISGRSNHSNLFKGNIDDVLVYYRALSADEAVALYDQ